MKVRRDRFIRTRIAHTGGSSSSMISERLSMMDGLLLWEVTSLYCSDHVFFARSLYIQAAGDCKGGCSSHAAHGSCSSRLLRSKVANISRCTFRSHGALRYDLYRAPIKELCRGHRLPRYHGRQAGRSRIHHGAPPLLITVDPSLTIDRVRTINLDLGVPHAGRYLTYYYLVQTLSLGSFSQLTTEITLTVAFSETALK